jgi:hypothetical protein
MIAIQTTPLATRGRRSALGLGLGAASIAGAAPARARG